jgi:hypothetical protein
MTNDGANNSEPPGEVGTRTREEPGRYWERHGDGARSAVGRQSGEALVQPGQRWAKR